MRDRFGLVYQIPSLREPIGFHLLIDGVYEWSTLRWALGQLRHDSVVVDVGACVGTFALPVAKKLGARGRVIAIEASPTAFGYLQRNAMLSELCNVETVQVAVSDGRARSIAFYEASPDHFGMGSASPQFNHKPIEVPARSLDELLAERGIDQVDILKVDVEGHEALVFEGSRSLLSRHQARVIIFEFCDWAERRHQGIDCGRAQEILLAWGYRIRSIAGVRSGGRRLQIPIRSGFHMLVAYRPQ